MSSSRAVAGTSRASRGALQVRLPRPSLYGRTGLNQSPGGAVVWTKENPTPWNDIKPNEGTKILTVNQHFDKRCVREPRGVSRLARVPQAD